MSLRRILIILVKDLKDAIRDARVLFALLLPLGIGLFYNATFSDDRISLIEAKVVYFAAGPDATALPALITSTLADSVEVETEALATAAEVEATIRADDADLGIVVPAGFDRAVAAGEAPPLQLYTSPDGSFSGDFVQAALPGILRQMAGTPEPAAITVTATAEAEEEAIFDRLSPQDWAIMSSLVTMIGMIALLAVPIVLAEEAEKKTLDALTMVSSYAEVVAGKALLGVVYTVVMVPMLLLITRQSIADWPIFVAATALITVALLGFGLLMAGLFKSANQLNTWAGLFLIPVIGPAFAVALPLPDRVLAIVGRIPTAEAAKLLLNASTGERLFDGQAVSLGVIALWALVAYALLLWRLSRREG